MDKISPLNNNVYIFFCVSRHFGASGNIYINGEPRNNKLFHKISSYIMQDDMVQPRLTVRELISSATELKLGSHYTQRAKDLIVSFFYLLSYYVIVSLGVHVSVLSSQNGHVF